MQAKMGTQNFQPLDSSACTTLFVCNTFGLVPTSMGGTFGLHLEPLVCMGSQSEAPLRVILTHTHACMHARTYTHTSQQPHWGSSCGNKENRRLVRVGQRVCLRDGDTHRQQRSGGQRHSADHEEVQLW